MAPIPSAKHTHLLDTPTMANVYSAPATYEASPVTTGTQLATPSKVIRGVPVRRRVGAPVAAAAAKPARAAAPEAEYGRVSRKLKFAVPYKIDPLASNEKAKVINFDPATIQQALQCAAGDYSIQASHVLVDGIDARIENEKCGYPLAVSLVGIDKIVPESHTVLGEDGKAIAHGAMVAKEGKTTVDTLYQAHSVQRRRIQTDPLVADEIHTEEKLNSYESRHPKYGFHVEVSSPVLARMAHPPAEYGAAMSQYKSSGEDVAVKVIDTDSYHKVKSQLIAESRELTENHIDISNMGLKIENACGAPFTAPPSHLDGAPAAHLDDHASRLHTGTAHVIVRFLQDVPQH